MLIEKLSSSMYILTIRESHNDVGRCYSFFSGEKVKLFNIISSSFFGNIIGCLSLFVGVISLAWTIITYRITKKIEKRLPEIKAQTINNMRFQEYRSRALKSLENSQKAAREAGKVSRKDYYDLMIICGRIKGYSLAPDDKAIIEKRYSEIVSINDTKKTIGRSEVVTYLEIVNELITILEKGEYDS